MAIGLRGVSKFFNNVGSGIRKFGSGVAKGVGDAARVVGQEVLPVVEKVAGGVATAAKYVAPALAFTPLAEFAPAVAAVGAGAAAIEKVAGKGRQLIKTGSDITSGVSKSFGVASNLASNLAPQMPDRSSQMMIRPVPTNPMRRLAGGM